jgi:hypothetical protein
MKSVFELITRLNEIHRELNNLGVEEIKMCKKREELIEEFDKIVLELWGHIPSLKDSADIQPKRRVRKYEDNRFVSENK